MKALNCYKVFQEEIICCSLLTVYSNTQFEEFNFIVFLNALLTPNLIHSHGFPVLIDWEQRKKSEEYSNALMVLSSALWLAELLSAAFSYLKSAPPNKYPMVSLKIGTPPGISQIVSTANFINR